MGHEVASDQRDISPTLFSALFGSGYPDQFVPTNTPLNAVLMLGEQLPPYYLMVVCCQFLTISLWIRYPSLYHVCGRQLELRCEYVTVMHRCQQAGIQVNRDETGCVGWLRTHPFIDEMDPDFSPEVNHDSGY